LVSTPLIYPGGKTLLLPEIRKVTPAHKFAIDLFAGSGAWILDGTHEEGIYNDINSEAVNFMRVCQDQVLYEVLLRKLESTPYSRSEYFRCDTTWETEVDPVERARRWFVVINLGFTHEEDCHSFRVGTFGNKVAGALRRHVDDLPKVHERLRDIVIEELDWRRCLAIYAKSADTLVFADPPYITTSSDPVGYRKPFTIKDHFDLLVALTNTPSQVILCGYESEMYLDMLRPPVWQLVKKVRLAQVGNSDYSSRDVRVEHIWVKKPLGGLWP
jgi:DNA adenine methylase